MAGNAGQKVKGSGTSLANNSAHTTPQTQHPEAQKVTSTLWRNQARDESGKLPRIIDYSADFEKGS